MSRSIHTNRTHVRHYPKAWFGRPHDEPLRDLARKRRIKAQVRAERNAEDPDAIPATDPSTIPVTVVDDEPYILYPAGPSDIRALLGLLPPHTVDGLAAIRLELGTRRQDDPCSRPDCGAARDPLAHRMGFERRPGLFAPHYHGCYADGTIRMFGYVVDESAGAPPRAGEFADLVEEELDTLVHEIAHHVDEQRRVARGRWLSDDATKTESFARRQAAAWVREFVVPYVDHRYRRG